jgi:cytochrome oxidase Cu insertion factor (SCO1/SenC/PrrC family)
MRLLLVSGGLLIMMSIGVGWLLVARNEELELSGPPLPVGPTVPEFSLTERSGRPITRADLLGKVWIADFVFTRCSGPCPTLSARMQALQSALADAPSVKLVTFTLDPVNDTVSVLADYAKRFHADPERWWFVTGDKEEVVQKFVIEGLKQTVIPAQGNDPLIHSQYLVIVDSAGRIRGAHDGLDAKTKPLVIRDVRKLLLEAATP